MIFFMLFALEFKDRFVQTGISANETKGKNSAANRESSAFTALVSTSSAIQLWQPDGKYRFRFAVAGRSIVT